MCSTHPTLNPIFFSLEIPEKKQNIKQNCLIFTKNIPVNIKITSRNGFNFRKSGVSVTAKLVFDKTLKDVSSISGVPLIYDTLVTAKNLSQILINLTITVLSSQFADKNFFKILFEVKETDCNKIILSTNSIKSVSVNKNQHLGKKIVAKRNLTQKLGEKLVNIEQNQKKLKNLQQVQTNLIDNFNKQPNPVQKNLDELFHNFLKLIPQHSQNIYQLFETLSHQEFQIFLQFVELMEKISNEHKIETIPLSFQQEILNQDFFTSFLSDFGIIEDLIPC